MKRLVQFLVSAGVGLATYVALIRPHVVQWGATDDELTRTFPGDDLVPDARFMSTHAITIHAPASDIWPWLVQIGNHRAGWYSFRTVEYLVRDGKLFDEGASHRILPEFQNLQVGDHIPVGNEAFQVMAMQPEQYVILQLVDKGQAAVISGTEYSLILDPIDAQTTRLIARVRIAEKSLWDTLITVLFFEPGHFIMQTKMLHGIKARAERTGSLNNP